MQNDVRRCGLSLQMEYRGLSVWRSVTAVSPAKTAEPIERPLGLWTQVGPPKESRIIWSAHWRNLANTTEPSMCGDDAAFLSNYFDHLSRRWRSVIQSRSIRVDLVAARPFFHHVRAIYSAFRTSVAFSPSSGVFVRSKPATI